MPDNTERELEQILGLLQSLKTAIDAAKTSMTQAGQGSATWRKELERLVALQQEYNTLQKQIAQRQSGTAPSGNVRVVSGGAAEQAAPGQAPLESALSGFRTKRERAAERELTALNRSARAEERRAKQAEEAAREAQRIADAREKVQNEAVYRDALSQAQARNYRVSDLQSIEDRGGGVQRLKFQRTQGGVNEQFNPYVNLGTGKATPGLSSQFRSFGSDIARDIGQFTKWSIAVAAVYTPLQKLGELMTIMVDNESRLADAAIAANIPFEKSSSIFEASAKAANSAGESISGVIDAYSQAIRAAGRYETETEKTQKATELLNDSLILSKLSALDQSTAIDTLSAALLQSDRELDEGQELLNKWVRVSQIANVSIDTLATGVAVLGDAAETSGLSIDELNGLIAVLSEQSISGSKEAANTAKALIGAYQGDKAEAALNKYGIALRKANGEARGFLEIYAELAKLREQGVLSESAVSELSLALGGGGVRRAKDASALINSVERLNKIAEDTKDITGEQSLADEALAKKLETVQTANTRLGNSFQELAQTLGDKGGLLDLFKGIINALTSITSASSDLFGLLGRSGPVLATFTTGLLALKNISPAVKGNFLSNLAGVGGSQAYGASLGLDASLAKQFGARGFGAGILSDVLSFNKRGAGIVGGLSVGASAISNLQAGKNENAIANVAGGAIGAAIGGALGGPIGIAAGASIGSSIADSFVTGMTTHSQDLADYFAGVVSSAKTQAEGGESIVPREITTEELIKEAYKAIGGGNEIVGSLLAFDKYNQSRFNPAIPTVQQPNAYKTQEAAALDLLKEKDSELYSRLQARFEQRNASENIASPGVNPAVIEANRQQIQTLQRLAEQQRSAQLEKVSTGELRPSEFGRISERLAGFPTAAKQEVDAFGKAFIDVSKDIDDTSDAYNALLELVVNGTDEQQAQINAYVSDIQKMKAEWENWNPATKDLTLDLTTGSKTFATKEQLAQTLAQTQQQAAQYTTSSITNARLQRLNLPSISGSATEATSGTDVQAIQQQAEKLQQQFYTDMNLTNEEIEHLKNGLEDFSLLVERAGEEHFETITGIDQRFWDAAQKLLSEQGKLKDDKGIGFQKYDVPIGTLQQLAQQSLSMGQSWQQKYNYDFKPEDQIAIDNQGVVQPLHADFKILALLLEKIVDQNQKQLDGQYNIPEGATFWVPLTAAYYRNKGGEGGGDVSSMLDSLAVDTNTSATERNTQAMNQLSEKFMMKNDPEGYKEEKKLLQQAVETTPLTPQREHLLRENGLLNRPSNTAQYNHTLRENGLGPTTPSTAERTVGSEFRTAISDLKQFFQSVFAQATKSYPGFQPSPGAGALGGGIGNRTTPTSAPTSPTSKLDLKISSNVNLMVDGRVLASTLQNYLASELLRTEQSQGTISKRYVI